MDKLIELLGTVGGPGTVIGVCLTLLFWVNRQSSGIRTEINGSIQRLTVEKESQQAEIEELEDKIEKKEATIDLLRKERREAEDRESAQRRRADELEIKLQNTEEALRLAVSRPEYME